MWISEPPTLMNPSTSPAAWPRLELSAASAMLRAAASRCAKESVVWLDSGPKGVGPTDQSHDQERPVASDQKSAVSDTPQPGGGGGGGADSGALVSGRGGKGPRAS
jgi:hypothetical protein